MSKVLIVDDEPDIHELLKPYLKKIEGVEIISAYSGEDAIKIYKESMYKNERIALVIMDLNLSGKDDMSIIELHKEGIDEKMDGVRTAKKILKIDENATIWGYTAWFDTDWSERLLNAGAKKVVERTVPFKEFADMIKEFLAHSY